VEIFPGGKNTTALTSPPKKKNKKRAKELARVSFALSYNINYNKHVVPAILTAVRG